MKIINKLIIICLVLTSSHITYSQTFQQAYANIVNQCSQTNVTNNLTEFQAFGVKRRGTAALQNTLNWLKDKYLSYGYTTSQFQEDSFTNGSFTCENLIVTKTGTLYPNTYVIVCGHYDSIGGSGTNDNGSGVVTILEIARLLQNVPTEYSIKFINFSGEEDGLIGSQHYVSSVVNATNPKMDIRLVFNIDEVGGVAGMVNNTITCEKDASNTPSTNNAASATKTNELITCVGLYSPLNTLLANAYASDYMPFEDNNEIITGFYETNETTHRHTSTDLLVNMDAVYNYNVAKAAIGATLHFAKASTQPLDYATYNSDYQITFFPNPVKDVIQIYKGNSNLNDYVFSLYDTTGKKIFSKTINNAKFVESITIDRQLNGIYLGVIENDTIKVTKSLIFE